MFFLTSQRILLWDIIRTTTFVVGSDRLAAPRASPDLSATRHAGSLYCSRYCSQFCYDDALRARRKYPEAEVIYHTPGLCFLIFLNKKTGSIMWEDSHQTGESWVKSSVFSGYIHVGMFSASPSKVHWATFGCIDCFPFCFFLCSCIQTYLWSRSL